MANVPVVDYPIELLDKITATDIEEYLEYLRYYVTEDGKEHTNGERGIMRKLACLRTLYRYFYKKEVLRLILLLLWICLNTRKECKIGCR